MVRESDNTSTAYLQHRLKIGHKRALRLMKLMEQEGILARSQSNRVWAVCMDRKIGN